MQEGAIDPKQSCDPIGRPVIGVRFFHLTIVFRLISWRAESPLCQYDLRHLPLII